MHDQNLSSNLTIIMDDTLFVTKLNAIVREHGFDLPRADAQEPSVAQVESWAAFLRECVKRGIKLSDPRWQRISMTQGDGEAQFLITQNEPEEDDDFRVGLALLMGMLHPSDEPDIPSAD